ncbi:competence type IV pilus minor pilin ComGF [Bacillus sp. NPDC077411]|uniref:competence type IV pilus minor pilin ComGF n=1 Tax=Bacillus sp. NPDC077411 TaxID=3363947 RepID=UPI0037CCA70B
MLKNKQAGFTLLEVMICFLFLSVFFLLLPRLQVLFIEPPYPKQIMNWEWNVFLEQVQIEFREVEEGNNGDGKLFFKTKAGERITYDMSGNNVVRKVNGTGHEVLLQKVENISYQLAAHTLMIRVQDISGKVYDGIVTRYSVIEVKG